MNEHDTPLDAAVRQIAEAAMRSAAMAAAVLSMMGESVDAVDVAHQVVSCILTNIMHANEQTSVKVTVELNGENVRTEVVYDFLKDSTDDNRLDPFKRFFDDKGL